MINGYKFVTLLTLFILLLAACSNEEYAGDPSQTTDKNMEHYEISENDQRPFVSEEDYSGEQLKLVELLNLSTKYRNESNSDKYMKLISTEPDTPIKQMNTKKIVDMKIYSIGDITEAQGSIVVMTILENETEAGFQHYVFRKINGEWKIYDID